MVYGGFLEQWGEGKARTLYKSHTPRRKTTKAKEVRDKEKVNTWEGRRSDLRARPSRVCLKHWQQ